MQRLKELYSSYYTSFLRQGQLPMRDTSLGFWSATITEELEELFKHLKQGTFLDLGSGDGKVVLTAALRGFEATGIECDPKLITISNKFKEKLNLNATFIHDDFSNHDLLDYNYIFINPDKPFHRGVDKLLENFNGTLIVYSDVFFPTNFKETKRIPLTRIRIYSS